MYAGANMERTRSRQLEDVSTNVDTEDITLTIPQPKASEIYYGACSKIYRHNRFRQESLEIDKKLQTHEWDKRENLGIFAMCVVDACMCYSNTTKFDETQEVYYLKLSEEMIDNVLDDNIVTRRWKIGDKTRGVTTSPKPLIGDNRRPKYSTDIHVTPIRRSKGGNNSSHTTQLRRRNLAVRLRISVVNANLHMQFSQE